MPAFGYCFANLFKTGGGAMSTAMAVNVVGGSTFFILGLILEIIPFETTRALLKNVGWIFRVWPVYSLGEAVRRIFFASYTWKTTPPEDVDASFWVECEEKYANHEVPPWQCCQSLFDKFGAGPAITWLFVDFILYIGVVILLDWFQQDVKSRQRFQSAAPLDANDPINNRQFRDGGTSETPFFGFYTEEVRVAGLTDASVKSVSPCHVTSTVHVTMSCQMHRNHVVRCTEVPHVGFAECPFTDGAQVLTEYFMKTNLKVWSDVMVGKLVR